MTSRRPAARVARAAGAAASPGPPGPAPPSAPEQQRAEAKARLRQLISKVNAAAAPAPAPADLAALWAAVSALPPLNPHPATATSALINGRWVLLYTANVAALRAAAGAAGAAAPQSGTPPRSSLSSLLSPLQLANDAAYRFFYANLPFLAGAAVGARGGASLGPITPRGNFQVFDTAAGRVENQARFDVGERRCCVNVNGRAEVVQPPGGAPSQRLRAAFTSFELEVDGRSRLSLPLWLLNPVGYVDTTYLDEELRISVGDKGSLFVAAREGR